MDDDYELWGSDSSRSSSPSPSSPSSPSDIGLYHLPSLLPLELQHSLSLSLSSQFTSHSNQLMLFPTASKPLPSFLEDLYTALPELLKPHLPNRVFDLLFEEENGERQVILNLYRPGEGISQHVDLPHRYKDGILGISLLSSATMDFRPLPIPSSSSPSPSLLPPYSVHLKPGDIYILSGPSRYQYKHGIEPRKSDWVEEENGEKREVTRGTRMSITLRRFREGANIVGDGVEEKER